MRLRPIPTRLVAVCKILNPIFSTISKCARSAPDWIVAPCDWKLGQREDEQDPECAWQTRRASDMVPLAASRRYENDGTEFQKSSLMLSMLKNERIGGYEPARPNVNIFRHQGCRCNQICLYTVIHAGYLKVYCNN